MTILKFGFFACDVKMFVVTSQLESAGRLVTRAFSREAGEDGHCRKWRD
jgi:hypothetical protein